MFEDYLNKDYIYLLFGFCIIILGLIFSKKLGTKPVSLKVEKIGFDLIADRLTLFFLLGFVFVGVGVFFKFKGYETRLASLENDLTSRETVEKQLSILKDYEFDMVLDFDTSLNISPQDKDLKYTIYKTVGGNIDHEAITPIFGPFGGTLVHLKHVKAGDKFRIIVGKSRTEQWESEEIEVPKTRIKLSKVK